MISQYINSCVSIMLFSLLTHIPLLTLNETNIMSIGNSSISKTAINIDMRYLSQHLSSCVPTRNTSNQTTASIIKNVPNLLFSCSKNETRTKQLYDRKVKYCFYIFSDKTDNVSTLWRSLLIPAAFSGVNATSTPVVIPDVFWGIFFKNIVDIYSIHLNMMDLVAKRHLMRW